MIDFIKQLAVDAGNICVQESKSLKRPEVEFKNPRDLVTVVDRKVEDFLVGKIKTRFPDHDIIGEETGRTHKGSNCCWIVDPIDGTTSYFHGQPFYSVSIAYQEDGELKMGVVNAPALGQLFHAVRGEGAYLNNEKIQVTKTSKLIDSLFATGFACLRAGWQENNLRYLNRILPKIRDIRRCGSAAMDLAYVASGKYDGYWEMNLNDYDIAAGVLLVQEAGGSVYDLQGGNKYPENGILATNGHLDQKILAFFKDDKS